MDMTPTRPAPDLNHLISSALQGVRFKERRTREAGSDITNQVVYFSPVVRVDADTQSVVIQYRDSETGQVLNQYPDVNGKMAAYQNAAETTDTKETPSFTASIPVDDTQQAPSSPSVDEQV